MRRKLNEESRKDWEEKMSQPMKPRKLTPKEIEALKEREKSLQNENLRFEKATEEEIEELRKQGRI